ncbi:sulfatase-like hydrolase/transferase [Rubrobacter tropicus]|uniref:Sulfatase-like hydrolase/transferase n=1 Tax=Rubrobacter tropicus TaxID=2653851 RepID=A0A6G8Q7E3_9ACTN|nr:sulfatase-like hydrolase/transferase [Rubrobacter tropicus]QIN82359.1 sulfatase-like hydrolase/transferase [Rubrobacter tropicus]
MKRLDRLLTRGDWIYLASLLVPLVVYNLVLKVVRIVTRPDPPGFLGFLDQVRSDLLFNLGFAALWIGVFAVVRGGWPRRAVLILFHLAVVVVVILTTSAHFFYTTTGSTLDLSFVLVSISSIGEIQGAIGSETTTLHWALVSVILFYTLAGPALLTRLFTGTWDPQPDAPGSPGRAPLTVGLAAVLLFSLSVVPSVTNAGNAFARDPLANMVVNEVATTEVEANVSPESLPTDTSLSPTPETEKRNVVLVFLESTRAESTTAYNDEIDTTPFLDELSEESLMAERAHAVVPHTSKALVATACGVPPPLDTQKTESEPGIIPARCLPELLEEQGYNSAFFQSATETFERRPQLVDNFGYGHFQAIEDMSKTGYQRVNYFGFEDEIMLKPSRAWLEENADDGPFMTTYLTVTPHHNYVVPQRYGTKKYSSDPELNRYLNTVRYQDFFLEKLFDQYKDLGLYEDTIFVILGDHGEGFGEHGLKQHDNTIYQEGLHIPLLVHDPKNPEPRRVEENVNELDVLPTVADMLGYRVEGGDYPGFSLLSPPEDRRLVASCYHERTCLASIDGDKKYIYSYGNRGEEYYDLSEDPEEKKNLIEEQGDKKIEDLRDDLLAWEARVTDSYEQQRPQEETTE